MHIVPTVTRHMYTTMAKFDGKVALITGAGSGIGQQTAVHLSTLGCSVALNGRQLQRLEATASQCRKHGLQEHQVLLVPGDISSTGGPEQIVKTTIEHFKKIDILINSAGILRRGDVASTSLADLDAVMNVNFRAHFHMLHLCIPHLITTKGCVVSVSSVYGERAGPGQAAYNIAKAALDQLTRCAASELAPQGVRVNSVNPSTVKTNLFSSSGMPAGVIQQLVASDQRNHPLGRSCTVEDVAKAIAFLVSDDASFITGESLVLDGARRQRLYIGNQST